MNHLQIIVTRVFDRKRFKTSVFIVPSIPFKEFLMFGMTITLFRLLIPCKSLWRIGLLFCFMKVQI